MAKRTKIEIDYDYKKHSAVIREIFTESGRVKRVIATLNAGNLTDLQDQVNGALRYDIAERDEYVKQANDQYILIADSRMWGVFVKSFFPDGSVTLCDFTNEAGIFTKARAQKILDSGFKGQMQPARDVLLSDALSTPD